MRLLLSAFIAVMILDSLSAEEKGRFQYEYAGYDNTPMISGTEFKVHQKDRPQPPRVIPAKAGKSVEFVPAPSDVVVLFNGSSLEHFQNSACLK